MMTIPIISSRTLTVLIVGSLFISSNCLMNNSLSEQPLSSDNASSKQQPDVTINLCCGEKQILNEKLECEEVAEKDNYTDIVNTIAVIDYNLNRTTIDARKLSVNLSYRQDCGEDVEVEYWSNSAPPKKYFSTADGNLLVQTQDGLMEVFSKETYCVDQARSNGNTTYAMLRCPCKVDTCIRKCCPSGEYYDTSMDKCTPVKPDIPDYHHDFYKLKNESSNKVTFHVMTNMPRCNKTRLQPYRFPVDNGRLPIGDEVLKLLQDHDDDSWCLDVFSNGTVNSTFLGGFYCRNETASASNKKITSAEVSPTIASTKMLHLPTETPVRRVGKLPLREEGDILNAGPALTITTYDSRSAADRETGICSIILMFFMLLV